MGRPTPRSRRTWAANYAGASVDAYYSKVNSAITATSLTAAQVAALPALGYSASNSLAATISDNTTYALMASYKIDPLKFFAGYMHIKYANPDTPLSAGFTDIGDYVLAFVTNNAYNNVEDRAGVLDRRSLHRHSPSRPDRGLLRRIIRTPTAPASRRAARPSAHSACSGSLEAFSFDADYRFNKHFDAYVGAMYSGVHDGVASGYLYTTNINPTRRRALQVLICPPRIRPARGGFQRGAGRFT